MDEEKVIQIKGTKRFFISEKGYVFKVGRNGIDEETIPIRMVKGVPRVEIESKNLNLILLMIEYFSENKEFIRYTFKITRDRIPLKNIRLINTEKLEEDEKLILKYKCREKSSAQNTRVKNLSKINDLDVLNCLKRTGFKCFYCGENIKSNSWHLDHVHPICLGGLNSKENITSSCKACNLMKGALPLDKFIYQINKIQQNLLINSL